MKTKLLILFFAIFATLLLFQSCKDDKNPVSSVTKPTLKVKISSFTPAKGLEGDVVVINCVNLSTDTSKNFVWFADNIPAKIDSITFSSASANIYTKVSSGSKTGKIIVQSGASGDTSVTDFKVIILPSQPVIISGFTPAKAFPGQEIVIYGTNFCSEASYNKVQIAGRDAKIDSAAIGGDKLYVTVPPLNITEKKKNTNKPEAVLGNITVQVGKYSATSVDQFSILESGQAITDFTPRQAGVGDTVIINGSNFGMDKNQVTVKFGAAVAQTVSVTPSQIIAITPLGATNDYISVAITNETAVSATQFTFLVQEITDFQPKTFRAGKIVKITGKHFGYDKNLVSVTFGSVTAQIVDINPNEITVNVPKIISNGNISVKIGSNTVVSKAQYVFYDDPTLSSFTPAQGFANKTIVTITGNNFGNDSTMAQVYFGAQEAQILLFSNTQIQVKVPNGIQDSIIVKVAIENNLLIFPNKIFIKDVPYLFSKMNFTLYLQSCYISTRQIYHTELTFSDSPINITGSPDANPDHGSNAYNNTKIVLSDHNFYWFTLNIDTVTKLLNVNFIFNGPLGYPDDGSINYSFTINGIPYIYINGKISANIKGNDVKSKLLNITYTMAYYYQLGNGIEENLIRLLDQNDNSYFSLELDP